MRKLGVAVALGALAIGPVVLGVAVSGAAMAQQPAGAVRAAYTVEPYAPPSVITIQGTGVRLRAEPSTATQVLSSGSTGLPLTVVGLARMSDWTWYQVILKSGQKAFIRSDLTSAPMRGGATTATAAAAPALPPPVAYTPAPAATSALPPAPNPPGYAPTPTTIPPLAAPSTPISAMPPTATYAPPAAAAPAPSAPSYTPPAQTYTQPATQPPAQPSPAAPVQPETAGGAIWLTPSPTSTSGLQSNPPQR